MLLPRTALLALTTLAATTTVNALGCYTSGIKWPNPDVARNDINRACYGYPDSNGAHIQGAFENLWFKANSESKLPASVCVNEQGYKIDLQVVNRGEARTLDPDECSEGLLTLVDCLRGGEGESSRFWFRADPNDGKC